MMSSLNAAVVAVVLATSTASAAAPPDKPNIVMVLTDDEDLLLGGASNRPLPVAADALRNAGATFSNHFVHTPVSAPTGPRSS
jgi:arylsulfatase A-like enzyme